MPGECAILRFHRQIPDLEAVQSIRPGCIAVPALRSVHARSVQFAVDFLRVAIDGHVLAPPHVHVLVVAGEQRSVHERDNRTRHAIAVRALAALRDDGAEVPAVHAVIPFAVAADSAVVTDLAGQDVIVGRSAFHPGIDVRQQPVAPALLAGQQPGIQSQRGRLHVQWAVADRVGVLGVMRQEFVEAAFAMHQVELAGVEGIACPVHGRGRAEQGTCAAIEHAADHAVFRIVVGRGRVAAVIEPCEAFRALDEPGVARSG